MIGAQAGLQAGGVQLGLSQRGAEMVVSYSCSMPDVKKREVVMHTPSKAQVLEARVTAGLSKKEAANLLHKATRTWERWEYGERKMDAAFWELFLIKTDLLQDFLDKQESIN